jgi:flagellar biosynthesis/type III secretory pathway protein FliH
MIIKKKQKVEKPIEQIVEEEVIEKEPTLQDELAKSSTDLFDLDNIDFSQRQENRRGERRRGYRRIDDRNLVSRAQEEADQIRQNAQQEGYEEGLAQANDVINELRSALENFVDAKDELFKLVAPNLLDISLDIAQKIVKKQVMEDPEVVLNIIYSVLDGLSIEEPKININANPIQVDLLRAMVPEYLQSKGCEAKINVIADDSIDLGGVVVHTVNGVIDATIPTQLEIIKEALKGE